MPAIGQQGTSSSTGTGDGICATLRGAGTGAGTGACAGTVIHKSSHMFFRCSQMFTHALRFSQMLFGCQLQVYFVVATNCWGSWLLHLKTCDSAASLITPFWQFSGPPWPCFEGTLLVALIGVGGHTVGSSLCGLSGKAHLLPLRLQRSPGQEGRALSSSFLLLCEPQVQCSSTENW